MRGLLSMAVLLACATPAVRAPGAEHKNPKGFSLTYPDGWLVATEEEQAAIRRAAEGTLPNLAPVDFSKVAAFIFDPEPDEFAPYINVVVTPGGGRVTEKLEQEYRRALSANFGRLGLQPAGITTKRVEVGGRAALQAAYTLRFPGHPEPVRQKQVIVPTGNKTYTLTCCAPASSFAKYKPVFDRSILSFQVEGGLFSEMPGAVRGGIIGAIVGGLVGVGIWLFRKLSATPQSPRSAFQEPSDPAALPGEGGASE